MALNVRNYKFLYYQQAGQHSVSLQDIKKI